MRCCSSGWRWDTQCDTVMWPPPSPPLQLLQGTGVPPPPHFTSAPHCYTSNSYSSLRSPLVVLSLWFRWQLFLYYFLAQYLLTDLSFYEENWQMLQRNHQMFICIFGINILNVEITNSLLFIALYPGRYSRLQHKPLKWAQYHNFYYGLFMLMLVIIGII